VYFGYCDPVADGPTTFNSISLTDARKGLSSAPRQSQSIVALVVIEQTILLVGRQHEYVP
jgi:hypothetical protein